MIQNKSIPPITYILLLSTAVPASDLLKIHGRYTF